MKVEKYFASIHSRYVHMYIIVYFSKQNNIICVLLLSLYRIVFPFKSFITQITSLHLFVYMRNRMRTQKNLQTLAMQFGLYFMFSLKVYHQPLCNYISFFHRYITFTFTMNIVCVKNKYIWIISFAYKNTMM